MSQRELSARRRKQKRRVVFGIVVAILIACIYAVVQCTLGAIDKPEQPATPSSTPTVILYPTFTPAPTPMPTVTLIPTIAPSIVAGDQGVNVRSGPGTSHNLIGYLEYGATAVATGYYNGWWQIQFEGNLCWVYGELVTAYNVDGIPQIEPTRVP